MDTKLLPAFVGQPELNRVYNVDALTLLRALPDASVDAVITDPPYGLAGDDRSFEHDGGVFSPVNELWDTFAPTDWMSECGRVLKPGGSVVCFGVRQSIYAFAAEGFRLGWRLVNDITWVKRAVPPNFSGRMLTESTERALWFCPTGKRWTYNLSYAKFCNLGINLRDVWYFEVDRENRKHPTQKPLTLMERCISLFTNEGDVIVDPFCGSGTTARAAINLGRHYLTCDITPQYVTDARNRLAQLYTPSFLPALDAASA